MTHASLTLTEWYLARLTTIESRIHGEFNSDWVSNWFYVNFPERLYADLNELILCVGFYTVTHARLTLTEWSLARLTTIEWFMANLILTERAIGFG